MNQLSITPVQICQGVCALAIAFVLGLNATPPIRNRLLPYGARQLQEDGTKTAVFEKSNGRMSSLLDWVAFFEVPHSWFYQFYVLSITLSLFWGYQIISKGYFFQILASLYLSNGPDTQPPMSLNQVALVWLALLIHGSRRFYESVAVTKHSNSKMSWLAWVWGFLYYVLVGLSLWVEGIPSILAVDFPLKGIKFSKPSTKTLVGTALIILGSVEQNYCHRYLASLKKYTLPDRQRFRWIVCPHYTSECVIYLGFAILSAPEGTLLNRTATLLLFVVITNLGVTAETSRKWYAERFGEEKIKGRWRMIPFVL